MLSIDPTNNTERENYKLLIGSIIPRPIAFVTTKSKEGTINGAPFSYFNIVSSNPPMISVSIQRLNGTQKDTARNIIESREFVVHIVDEENVEKINLTAANLSCEQSELEIANLTPVESTKVSIPGIKEAKIRLECTLVHSLALGGKDSPGCELMIGKVVHFHIGEEIYENGRINASNLKAVSRLAGQNYAKIGETFSLKRPE